MMETPGLLISDFAIPTGFGNCHPITITFQSYLSHFSPSDTSSLPEKKRLRTAFHNSFFGINYPATKKARSE